MGGLCQFGPFVFGTYANGFLEGLEVFLCAWVDGPNGAVGITNADPWDSGGDWKGSMGLDVEGRVDAERGYFVGD